jgi:hypothetical protein
MLFFGTAPLAGDYNNDGVVSAGDYVTWRRALSMGGSLANETASPGVVDQADYTAWRTNFGATGSGSGGGVSADAVPEPASAVLLLVSAGIAVLPRVRRHAGRGRLRISGTFLQE